MRDIKEDYKKKQKEFKDYMERLYGKNQKK